MDCIKCKDKNINSANFCKKCGYNFSKNEQKAAKSKTIIGKIVMLENWYKTCTLKIITDHILFKIATVIVILLIGIFTFFKNGNDIKILPSDNYEIQYNKKLNEYYLLTKDDSVSLNLYVPEQMKRLTFNYYDENDELESVIRYRPTSTVVLENNNFNYYVLESDTSKNIKFYVYKVD